MSIAWVDVSAEALMEWKTLRETLAECIGVVVKTATGARIYPHWIYEIDVISLLGKVTAAMRATTGTSAGTVHCWTIGISDASYIKNQNGDVDTMGGYHWKWRISLDVWGFFENDGTSEAQRRAENEARLVSAMIFRNSMVMVENIPRLSRIQPLEFTAVQPTPFSDGTNPIVASGKMQAEITEAVTI